MVDIPGPCLHQEASLCPRLPTSFCCPHRGLPQSQLSPVSSVPLPPSRMSLAKANPGDWGPFSLSQSTAESSLDTNYNFLPRHPHSLAQHQCDSHQESYRGPKAGLLGVQV